MTKKKTDPKRTLSPEDKRFFESVASGMRAAARRARRIARMYGTPIYVWENGKVVAKKP
jgi:hypothetical protein